MKRMFGGRSAAVMGAPEKKTSAGSKAMRERRRCTIFMAVKVAERLKRGESESGSLRAAGLHDGGADAGWSP